MQSRLNMDVLSEATTNASNAIPDAGTLLLYPHHSYLSATCLFPYTLHAPDPQACYIPPPIPRPKHHRCFCCHSISIQFPRGRLTARLHPHSETNFTPCRPHSKPSLQTKDGSLHTELRKTRPPVHAIYEPFDANLISTTLCPSSRLLPAPGTIGSLRQTPPLPSTLHPRPL